MASTILSDNGVSSGSAGIKTTADSTGALALQTTTAGGAATTALTIDTSQNVGIGTSSPTAQLHVSAAAQTQLKITNTTNSVTGRIQTETGDLLIQTDTNHPIGFAVNNGSQCMRIDTSGNVGIGTTSPGARVDVRTAALGTALQLSDDTNYGANFIGISGGLKLAMNGTQTFSVFQTTNERLTIDGSGNLKFNSGYGSAATAYGCRAWVNFNGTGTVAIRASGNVSSITDVGAGIYTVNFTTAISDANYAVTVNVRNTNGGDFGNVSYDTDITTSAAKVNSFNAAGASVDVSSCYVTIFR